MNLDQINRSDDPTVQWATEREFDLRWIAWRRHRLGAIAIGMGGVTNAVKRLSVVLGGER
jgi:hypothetical protein